MSRSKLDKPLQDGALRAREERLLERADDDEVDPHDEVGHAVAILGSASRKGRWTPPGTLRAISLMGTVNLDFREADLLEETDVDVFTLMGSVNIIVPPSVDQIENS